MWAFMCVVVVFAILLHTFVSNWPHFLISLGFWIIGALIDLRLISIPERWKKTALHTFLTEPEDR
jgi:hypothetical protein